MSEKAPGKAIRKAARVWLEQSFQWKDGLTTVSSCRLCGSFLWRCREQADYPVVAVEWHDPNVCEICLEVAHRSPETFAWVRRVLARIEAERDE